MRKFEERGATAVEYAITVALIAATIITAALMLGRNSESTYQCTVDSVAAQSNRC